jgi:transposase
MEKEEKATASSYIKDLKRNTKRRFTAEEKIRIVMMGLRGEAKVSEICRQVGVAQSLYYKWTKDFLEAGKDRLAGDTKREANSTEVKQLRGENEQLKQVVAEQALDIRGLKKSLNGNI